jgi:hypothetical protein
VTNASVLVLNKNFQPIHITSAKRAFSLLYLGVARAIDEQFRVFDFESWAQLSTEMEGDSWRTIGGAIRIPRVIILQIYDRLPRTKVRFSRHLQAQHLHARRQPVPVLRLVWASHGIEPRPRGATCPRGPHELGKRGVLLHQVQFEKGGPHSFAGQHAAREAARTPTVDAHLSCPRRCRSLSGMAAISRPSSGVVLERRTARRLRNGGLYAPPLLPLL